jgi:phage baseplate assembly protein W
VADDRHLLTDIRLGLRHHELRPVYTVDSDQRRVPGQAGLFADIGTVSGRDNLEQAIMIRLLTPAGELAELGHAEYGSRLHELIGRQNTDTTRNLVKLYILDSLQREPRIQKIDRVEVAPVKGTRDRVSVLLSVTPIGFAQLITIGPFTLEFAQ